MDYEEANQGSAPLPEIFWSLQPGKTEGHYAIVVLRCVISE